MLHYLQYCFNDFGENTYIVYDESDECVIVDPGMSNASEFQEIVDAIDEKHLNPILILNTHAHVDHIIGNGHFAEYYHVKVAAHPDSKRLYEMAQQQSQLFGFPLWGKAMSAEIDLSDYELIKIGGGTLEVICTPGHADGSVSFYAEAEGFVMTGDALFCRGIGRTDFVGGSYELLRKSIRERLFKLPDDTLVLPGHGGTTTIGEEKDFNPFVAL